jgi:hypothetical protein
MKHAGWQELTFMYAFLQRDRDQWAKKPMEHHLQSTYRANDEGTV